MKFFKDLYKNRTLVAMTLPALAIFIAFSYLPMFGLVAAFKDFHYKKGILGSDWTGFDNFKFLFQSGDAFIIVRNTLLYNVCFIILGMTISITFAILFDSLGKSKLNKINQTISIMPHFLSWVVIGYFVTSFLSADKGLFNQILTRFGLPTVDWYSDAKYWPYILIFTYLWRAVGYSSIIYFANIRGFDVEFYEAAKIDGATWLQQVRYITIPLLKSIAIVMLILSIGGIFNSDFGLFFIIPKNSGALYPVTSTIDTYVYNGMIQGGQLGMTSATGFLQSIVGFALVLTANGIVRKISKEDAMF